MTKYISCYLTDIFELEDRKCVNHFSTLYTYQSVYLPVLLDWKRLIVGFVLEVPILTKDSPNIVWNGRHSFVNDEFCSALDDNTYKDFIAIYLAPLLRQLIIICYYVEYPIKQFDIINISNEMNLLQFCN